MKRLTLRLSDAESDALTELADELEMTKNDLVRQILREGLLERHKQAVQPVPQPKKANRR